jgi:hypothetical protein
VLIALPAKHTHSYTGDARKAGASRQFKRFFARLTSYGFCVLLVPLLASCTVSRCFF